MGHLNEHIINNNNNNNNNNKSRQLKKLHASNQTGLKVLAIKPADVYCSFGLEKVYIYKKKKKKNW